MLRHDGFGESCDRAALPLLQTDARLLRLVVALLDTLRRALSLTAEWCATATLQQQPQQHRVELVPQLTVAVSLLSLTVAAVGGVVARHSRLVFLSVRDSSSVTKKALSLLATAQSASASSRCR